MDRTVGIVGIGPADTFGLVEIWGVFCDGAIAIGFNSSVRENILHVRL